MSLDILHSAYSFGNSIFSLDLAFKVWKTNYRLYSLAHLLQDISVPMTSRLHWRKLGQLGQLWKNYRNQRKATKVQIIKSTVIVVDKRLIEALE